MVQAAVLDDGAADTGAVCDAEKVTAALSRAKAGFRPGGAVYIILHCHRNAQLPFQKGPHRRAGIICHRPIVEQDNTASVHLSTGADANGIHGSHFTDDLRRSVYQVSGAGYRRGSFPHRIQSFVLPHSRFDGCSPDIQSGDPSFSRPHGR